LIKIKGFFDSLPFSRNCIGQQESFPNIKVQDWSRRRVWGSLQVTPRGITKPHLSLQKVRWAKD